jgi:hypothetical protein
MNCELIKIELTMNSKLIMKQLKVKCKKTWEWIKNYIEI